MPNVDPARTAALAVDLRTGAVVYSRNAALALVPASNQKLPVAYAALALLGPGYRFHTEIVGSGTLVGDVWHGDLWLRGYGDPDTRAGRSRRARDGRRLLGHPPSRRSGDRRRVVVRCPPGRPGLEARLLHLRVAAAVGARRRPRTLPGPDLREPGTGGRVTLPAGARATGVSGGRRTRSGVLTTAGLPLAQDVSEPLADIVRFMGRESDNYTAEVLVKQLGAVYAGRGSTAAGVAVVRDALDGCRASRSPACGSPTAPASPVSTG